MAKKAKARKEVAPVPSRSVSAFWLLLPALLLITLAVYHPVWRGGMLWDDDDHLTKAELQSTSGLVRIWFDVGATQQYYPVVHTTFWVLNRLWGGNTLPYHLLNIGLHALSAFLFAVILRRLSFSTGAAVLAAAIFAVHPVHVESVAWMTELKNTMSGVWYLAAALAYLNFDRDRRPRDYALALVLFVLALLSKTVTASLPAALLVVFWWQRGRLDWRRDIRPLVPFFVLGLAGGVFTAWVEHTYIGAQGFEYSLTPIERVLVAGRAIWFYLYSLVWPANLIFIYPRWQVSQAVWWQYLFPIAAIAGVATLWWWRSRSRAPLAAALFFIGTLVPALGFVNIFPFRYSYVADHFQYLASLGIIAIVSAGLMILVMRRSSERTATMGLVAAVCIPLGLVTWHESANYRDVETLYRTTIARNPECWMAYNNLAALKLLGSPADTREALELIQQSLAINPDNAEARNNLGYVLQSQGRYQDAIAEHQAAIRLLPTFADAHNSLGMAYKALGRLDEAEREFREAIRLKPNYALAHQNLGVLLLARNRPDEAKRELDDASRIDPDRATAHLRQALMLRQVGRWAEAADEYREALKLKPDSAPAENGLGYVLLRLGKTDEARAHLEAALRLDPQNASVHFNLANALLDAGRADIAVIEFRLALKYEPAPGSAETHNNLGIALAQQGKKTEAIAEFTEALRIQPDFKSAQDNLARAKSGR